MSNVKCMGFLKGNWDYMLSNVGETRSNTKNIVFRKSCVEFGMLCEGYITSNVISMPYKKIKITYERRSIMI